MLRISTFLIFTFLIFQTSILPQSCDEVTERFISCFKELKKEELKTPENQKKFKEQEKIMIAATKKTCDKNKTKVFQCYNNTLDSCLKFQDCISNNTPSK